MNFSTSKTGTNSTCSLSKDNKSTSTGSNGTNRLPMVKCRYCNQNAGFLRKQHGPCRDLHATGIQEITKLAAQAADTHTFNEAAFRQILGPSPSAHDPPTWTSGMPSKTAPRIPRPWPPSTRHRLTAS